MIFAIRTRRVPFFGSSRPGLRVDTGRLAVVAVGVTLTVSPLAHQLGFTALPWQFFTALVLFTIVYLLLVEMKTVFYTDPMMHLPQRHTAPAAASTASTAEPPAHSRASRIAHPPSGPAPLPPSVPDPGARPPSPRDDDPSPCRVRRKVGGGWEDDPVHSYG